MNERGPDPGAPAPSAVAPERLEAARARVRNARRIVIKVGSNVLVGAGRSALQREVFCRLVATLAELLDEGERQIVLVSSGAVALGRRAFAGTPLRTPDMLASKQALAAVGQPALMHEYALEFGHYGRRVAQLLMSREDFHDRNRFLNARRTLRHLTTMPGVLPILNENDTLSSDEIRFGDNDQLAALTTTLFEADLLVLLSDVAGLHAADPREAPDAPLLAAVSADDPALEALCAPPPEWALGSGGMRSKVLAARMAASYGLPTLVANGRCPEVLGGLLGGEVPGTLFVPVTEGISARKAWLRFSRRCAGQVHVDAGAAAALQEDGRSLLARGIRRLEGEFEVGDAVEIVDPGGRSIARGLVADAAGALGRIVGLHGDLIEQTLGFTHGPVVVHRDDLALA